MVSFLAEKANISKGFLNTATTRFRQTWKIGKTWKSCHF